ncbi:hypothetical protein DI272_18725 [Streptomyces sp. Act143]|uniref:hypothetical protein n=1 Tax=Streptomyces sp. Act143 TaxID=2200760 RepID=UPI000D67BBB1|nr:hypothetical protein [Streptomyces sp. Act143]PWI15970.1 hypothetical protein DI272_18725 [Streptomyces sp. Act143]
MSDGTDELTVVEQPKLHVAPPGHSRAGHRAFGWCSRCPGREVWEELLAWRQRDNQAIDETPTPDRVTVPSREAEKVSADG